MTIGADGKWLLAPEVFEPARRQRGIEASNMIEAF
jgi:hypothetical protein